MSETSMETAFKDKIKEIARKAYKEGWQDREEWSDRSLSEVTFEAEWDKSGTKASFQTEGAEYDH